ncbi:MAG: hypothetical protein R2724_28720 [Bryobacterales bacterium]
MPHHMMNQMVSMVGPMTHGGGGMQPASGCKKAWIIRGGGAMGEANGPALGRGLGMAADHERASSAFVHQQHGDAAEGRARTGLPAGHVDAYGSPRRPQARNYGLRKEWTASMMGMMTLIRVLEPEMFDKIAELKRQQVRA